jgi:hypothetical protein
MNFRVTVCAALAVAVAGCSSSSGVYRWVPFVGNGKKEQSNPAVAKVAKSNPFGPITGPLYYGLETRSLEVHLVLINRTKKPVNLQFSDSRKYDFILRDMSGKKLAQWSDDQPVNQNPGYVIVDPGERVEFVGNVSTRDMVAGRTYALEALVVGYDKMRQTVQLTPIPGGPAPAVQRPPAAQRTPAAH